MSIYCWATKNSTKIFIIKFSPHILFKNMQIFKNIRPNLNECFSGRMELMKEIKNSARYLVSLSSLWELSKLACFDIRPRVSPIIQFVLKLDRKKDNQINEEMMIMSGVSCEWQRSRDSESDKAKFFGDQYHGPRTCDSSIDRTYLI